MTSASIISFRCNDCKKSFYVADRTDLEFIPEQCDDCEEQYWRDLKYNELLYDYNRDWLFFDSEPDDQ